MKVNEKPKSLKDVDKYLILSGLEQLQSELHKAIRTAKWVAEIAERISDETSQVVVSQLSYTIGHLKAFADDENQPGSVASLLSFLKRKRKR